MNYFIKSAVKQVVLHADFNTNDLFSGSWVLTHYRKPDSAEDSAVIHTR